MHATSQITTVAVDDVDVRYKIFEEHRLGARELIRRGFRRRASAVVHALKGVSLTVTRGEAVGIVGSNGSGKSTLLRAIAGLQSIDSGSIGIRGDAHLLGVNAALVPALSGYRNVVLGGLALGLTHEEIDARMEEVEQFAEIGEAMARPMNTYSSGMRARLAFSIATLRVPDILLLDEALAVGDRKFKQKSLERINQIRDGAGTVIMVTHGLREVRKSCTRAVWLEQGELRADGGVDEVLELYSDSGDT